MSEYMELQEDILIEILARLPVKVLIQFTCVCKYWLSIIRSPEFATKHYSTRSNYLLKNKQECDSLLTTFFPSCIISIFSYQTLTLETAFEFRPAVVCYPPRFGIYYRDIITNCFIYGPCNGLFLIQLTKANVGVVLLLWNPATREVFKLPSKKNNFEGWFAGFGFDHVRNDYKVVNFDGTNANSSVVLFYSLAANSWKQVDGGVYFGEGGKRVAAGTPSMTSGSKHHWIICDFEYKEISLLSFDMVDEAFVETPLPENKRYCHGFLHQGSNHEYPVLYYMDDEIQGTKDMHIWVLKRYGPSGFWDKLRIITVPEVVSLSIQMVLWKTIGIVFSNTDSMDVISWYNMSTRRMKSLQISGDMSIIGYTESLVSIAKFVCQPTPQVDGEEAEDSSAGIVPARGVQRADHQEGTSTDSACLMSEGTSYVDNDRAENFQYHRKNEQQRYSRLPYCLHEVNQPMIPNPCTF